MQKMKRTTSLGVTARNVLRAAGWAEVAVGPGYVLALDCDGRRRAIYILNDLIAEVYHGLQRRGHVDPRVEAIASVECTPSSMADVLAKFVAREICWCQSLRLTVSATHPSCDLCHLT